MGRSGLSNQLHFLTTNARWLGGGMMLTVFSSFGQAFFIALFGSQLRHALQLSHGELGSVFMLGTLASAICFLRVGQLTDAHAVRRVAVFACTALGAACLLMSAVTSVWALFLAIFALRLFGQGLMTHIAMVAMGRWYAAERGRAVAIAALGHQIGVALLPLVVVSAIAALGWRTTWALGGLSLLVIALPLIYLLMRVERTPRGTTPDGTTPTLIRQWNRAEVARDPLYWVTLACLLLPALTGTSVMFHQAYLGELKRWSPELIASAISAMALANVASSLLSGSFVDRHSASRLLPMLLLPIALACFVLAHVDASWAIVVFMLLLGCTQGMQTTLFGSLFPETYGTDHLGSIRAMLMTAVVVATAVGPGLSGWLIDRGVDVGSLLRAAGIGCVIGIGVLTVVSRALLSRRSVVEPG